MRIGFISDIHSNQDALEKVLEYCRSLDQTICCGDLVGYYDRPEEICQTIKQSGFLTILGNHDLYVLNRMDYLPDAESRYRTIWTREQLSANSYNWLKSLSIEENIELDGWKIKVRHANPWDTYSYLYEDSPLLSKILIPDRQALVFGHTHRPYMIKKGGGMVINCGSVGQPRSGLPGAQITEFDTTRGLWKQLHIEYDYNGMQDRLKSMGWNEKVVKKLSLE